MLLALGGRGRRRGLGGRGGGARGVLGALAQDDALQAAHLLLAAAAQAPAEAGRQRGVVRRGLPRAAWLTSAARSPWALRPGSAATSHRPGCAGNPTPAPSYRGPHRTPDDRSEPRRTPRRQRCPGICSGPYHTSAVAHLRAVAPQASAQAAAGAYLHQLAHAAPLLRGEAGRRGRRGRHAAHVLRTAPRLQLRRHPARAPQPSRPPHLPYQHSHI